MDSREGYKLLEEADDSLEDSVSISGFWSESESEGDGLWFTESCAAVLEPSKDESRDADGKLKDCLEEFFTLSLPEIETEEVPACSGVESPCQEAPQQSTNEHYNSKKQQSSSEHHNNNSQHSKRERHNSNEKPITSGHRKSNEQSSSEHHSNNNQPRESGRHDNNEQPRTSGHRKSSDQQSSSENRNNNEQPRTSGHRKSNDQQSSSEHHNNNQHSKSEHHNSNEQPRTSGHRKSSDQQSSSENRNNNEEQNYGEHYNSNEKRMDEPEVNCCATFLNSYKVNSHKIRDSWFIHIFQLLASLLSVSEIVMAIIFYGSCDPQPSPIPIIALLMGVSGLALVYSWVAKVCRNRRSEYCWNLERNKLSVFLVIFLVLLTLEVAFFVQASPKTVQSKLEVKCIKTYYDYLYYMFFAIGGSLVLAVLIYLPACCMLNYQSSGPSHTNGHYEPL